MKVKEFSPPNKLKTPVLFLVFNRLDTTIQVFGEIKKAKPPRLYIASDGAREAVKGEFEKVKAIRSYLSSNIDWECEVKTLYRDKNLGCKYAVSSAIDWFFENEEMGIILEDDCLPSQSFFWYCQELLNMYKEDLRIWHISGAQILNLSQEKHSYHFSKYPGIWGWATWANRWKEYDVKLVSYNNIKDLQEFNLKVDTNYWNKIFKRLKENKIDTWDFQWVFTVWYNNGLSITPNVNLIKNIGFDSNATHTKNSESNLANLENQNINIIIHPSSIRVDEVNDSILTKQYFSLPSFALRILNKLKSLL